MKTFISYHSSATWQNTVAKVVVERKNELTILHGAVFVINIVVTLVTAALTSMRCKFLYFFVVQVGRPFSFPELPLRYRK